MTFSAHPEQSGRPEGGHNDTTREPGAGGGSVRAQESGGFASALAGLVLSVIPELDVASWPLIALGLLLSALRLIRGDERSRRGLATAGLVLALVAVPLGLASSTGALQSGDLIPPGWQAPSQPPGPGPDDSETVDSGTVGGSSMQLSRADVVYLQVLDDHGIDVEDEDGAISAGHSICQSVNRGYSLQQAGQILVNNNDITYHDSAVIIGAALGAYCPASN